METKRYRMLSMGHAQCHVAITWNNNVIMSVKLISYSTTVIEIYRKENNVLNDEFYMCCTGTYSSTTSRHINRFTCEFLDGNRYYLCKSIVYSDDYKLTDYEILHMFKMCYEYLDNGKKYYGHY